MSADKINKSQFTKKGVYYYIYSISNCMGKFDKLDMTGWAWPNVFLGIID